MPEFDPYSYSITVRRVDVDGQRLFAARVAELPHVEVFEASAPLAVEAAADIILGLFEAATEEGRSFPPPIVRRAVAERDAILAGAPSLQQRWIPVTEAIPMPEVFVLCWDGRQTFVECFGSKRDAGRGVTHWMPYPMPPGAASEMHDGARAIPHAGTRTP